MNYVQSKAGELEKYKADFDELEKGNVWLFNWKKFVLYVPEDISYLLLCFLILYLFKVDDIHLLNKYANLIQNLLASFQRVYTVYFIR